MTENHNAISRLYHYLYIEERTFAPESAPESPDVPVVPAPPPESVDEPLSPHNTPDHTYTRSNRSTQLLAGVVAMIVFILIGNSIRIQINQNSVTAPNPAVTKPPSTSQTNVSKINRASAISAANKTWSFSELMALGEKAYNTNCAACHQASGMGIPGVFPAISGSQVVIGDINILIDIVMNGKAGTAMMGYGTQLTNTDIAAIITYQRNAMGNNTGDYIQPPNIKTARHSGRVVSARRFTPVRKRPLSLESKVSSGTILLDTQAKPDAKRIQQRLADLGFYQSRIDGIWGRGSTASLIEFLKSKGLSASLGWGIETQLKLFQPTQSKSRTINKNNFENQVTQPVATTKTPLEIKSKTSTQSTSRVTIETNFGNIVFELDPVKAPNTVKNFLHYVENDFYDGTLFHRVIPGFMIQGGGYNSGLIKKPTSKPIRNEASNRLKNLRGTLAMARTSKPHSATTQFFINLTDNSFLDYTSSTSRGWGYTVFGKVTKGMDVIDKIGAVRTNIKNGMEDVPTKPVYIKNISW